MHTYIHTYIRMSQAAARSGRKLLAVHEMRVAVAVTVT